LRTTIVILTLTLSAAKGKGKDLRLLFLRFAVRVGKAMMPNLRWVREKSAEKQPQILRRCAPQDDRLMGMTD
jgi:hypothetical protein